MGTAQGASQRSFFFPIYQGEMWVHQTITLFPAVTRKDASLARVVMLLLFGIAWTISGPVLGVEAS